ncbi:MAG TPA: hypothetical protein DHU96_22270 [Actinobacteria bacterium]|nr:hypothetical protein [Actinomycetota bacterium]
MRNLLGFLVAGFAGALNLLGLKSAEIGVVLRNQSFRVSIVAIFLLAGILAAVASVFVKSGEHHWIPVRVVLTVLLPLISLFSLSIWMIPSPFGANTAEHYASVWVSVALWVISAALLGWTIATASELRKDRLKKLPDLLNLQSLLLVAAVMLTSTATYGVLRLETISQASTVAEIGDTLQAAGQDDALSISISAAKLSTSEWLGINVMAAPRRWNLKSMCRSRQVRAWKTQHGVAVTCQQDPCYYFGNALPWAGRCTELSEDVIPPDASGGVQRTIQVLLSPRAFQHVQVTAVTCEPPPIIAVAGSPPLQQASTARRKAAVSKIQPKGTCRPAGGESRLDIAVPKA